MHLGHGFLQCTVAFIIVFLGELESLGHDAQLTLKFLLLKIILAHELLLAHVGSRRHLHLSSSLHGSGVTGLQPSAHEVQHSQYQSCLPISAEPDGADGDGCVPVQARTSNLSCRSAWTASSARPCLM